MSLKPEVISRLLSVLDAETSRFVSLTEIARLDPGQDFQHLDLRGIDLRGENLRGFDFTGSDLTGADLRSADLTQVRGLEAAILTDIVADARTRWPADRVAQVRASHVVTRPFTTNPAAFPVSTESRPSHLASLLSDSEVLYENWDEDVRNRRLYYVDGIVSFLRMFPGRRAIFLKEEALPSSRLSAIDMAVKEVRSETSWPLEAMRINWNEQVAANQLRRARNREPLSFTKAVHTIVACQIALRELRPDVSEFWVYDYMRIIPAVYNIDGFYPDVAEKVVRNTSIAAQMSSIAGPDWVDMLTDLANGACVTRKTAFYVADLLRRYDSPDSRLYRVGAVRYRPGKRRLGRKDASRHEFVEIR